MGKEAFEAGAQITLTGFAGGGAAEPMLGAVAVTGEEEWALAAGAGKAVALGVAEGALARAENHLAERGFKDIAKPVVRVDVVIAGVKIAVVFEHEGVATGFSEDAERAGVACPAAESDIEVLDKNGADIVADPLVEDGDEEIAEAAWVDRPGGDRRARSAVRRGLCGRRRSGEIKPELLCVRIRKSLDQGNELHEGNAQIFQEAVDLEGMAFVSGADDGEGIEGDVVLEEQLYTAADGVERGSAVGKASELVV